MTEGKLSMDELAQCQSKTGEAIETIIRNYKKDSVSRKNHEYYKERLRRLNAAWLEFESTDNKIRCLEKPPLEHEYFVSNYYDGIKEIVEKYRELFESAIQETPTVYPKTPIQPEQGPTTAKPTPLARATSTNSAIRRQNIMMASLKRIINTDSSSTNMKIKEKLWDEIQALHFSIWENSCNPQEEGYDMQSYISLEALVIENFKSTSVSENTVQQYVQNNVFPLPKITIPKFNGDYLKWPAFFDLFSQLVINQNIPTVQKMWYLKANLTGEAEKLINHLSATAENYDTALKILQDRYSNKRVLVASLIQQLIDQPSAGSSAASIKQLHDVTQECIHALTNMGIDTSSWSPILLHLLVKKLDRGLYGQYEKSISNPKELQHVNTFLEFLETRFQSMEAMNHKEKVSTKSCASAASTHQTRIACNLCNVGSHQLYQCQTFLKMTPAERLNFTQRQKHCVNCLKSGHSSKQCTARCCLKCSKKHNTLLHLEQKQATKSKKEKQVSTSEETAATSTTGTHVPNNQEATSLAAANGQQVSAYVILGTAVVKIKTNDTEVECRALLDSGSQVNFITERLVKRLGISKQNSTVNINGIGSSNTKTKHRVNVALQSRINNYSTRLEAFVLPRILSPQPSQFINTEHWSIPKNLTLADPAFNRPDKIDILLGAEHFHELLSIGQIKLGAQLPTMQNTVFGWIIAGKIQEENARDVTCGICTTDDSLDASIARLWEMEEIKSASKPMSIEEKQCEIHFEQHTVKDQQNRFMVRIPFHQSPDALGDSHGIAINRFFSLERRLQKNPELKAQYVRFMEEYEELGHMTKVPAEAIRAPNYFIPHHCIQRPESSTTKLRVVFDASAKTSSGHSLNDLMYTGPTVQSELFSILLRFRLPKYVFTTDVEKMYRQIFVSPEDRQFQLIIWRKDTSLPITYYQLNTVTYGTRSAPYLATKCLQRLAHDSAIRYPLASQFLQENFYVDDGLGGCDSLVTAIQLQQQLIQVMKENGFNLRKWCANNPQLLKNISQGDQEVNLDFENSKVDSIKTLGLTWLPKDDTFCVKVNVDGIRRITKRTVTSDLARLFDPLGILSPVIVMAKVFIQELWELKIDWDQSLPESLHTKWTRFREDLKALKALRISRHISKGKVPQSIQLHIFTDASEKAYGAAAYIRSTFKDGSIMTRLLCAKSRVAPLKRQTIPRLELCAAVLGAQLASKIKTDLQLTCPIWFWTDSEIVLAWINSSSAAFNTFVANRLSVIHEMTQAEQWRHVSSKCNPADILSRGISPAIIKDCTLWFCGPIFLHGQESGWPAKFNPHLAIQTNLEAKRKAPEALVTSVASPDFMYKINHNNSFSRLQRIVAYILRFINQCRRKGTIREAPGLLTTVELDLALMHIIRHMQESDFREELQHLKKYQELRGTSNLRNLAPFLDNFGLMRVGGRLEAASLSYDTKHPLLIPYNDPIAKLIFEMIHTENKHCGAQTLLGIIRQRFWPLKGKLMARATVHRCIRCSRAKPALFNQVMGNLPSTRVTPARPFINTGVDYCGPVTVHYKLRGKRPHKAYIAVFCCFATKAVHLELVSELTTEAFIGALKRFIGRRGHCQKLYCDNATNFVGAKNKLPELATVIHTPNAQEAITSACNKKGIQFNFIPPRAPHFGGLWEAAVKSAKHLLVRSMEGSSLTYEELETLIVEIEAILNSRPISPMSNDPNDIGALTPGHFLIGEPLTAQVDSHAQSPTSTLATRWKQVSQLKHDFWNRWSRDYLTELQCRNKWQEQSKNLEPGAIVILKEDNVPVMKWPLGRVIKTYKGPDNKVRVADVKTASGVFKRAIHYLAPLPKLRDDHDLEHQSPTSPSPRPIDADAQEEQPSSSSDERPSRKKRRISCSSTMVAMMAALIVLPLICASKVHITKFTPDIGIHFEGIGTTHISRSEWKIITYYELQPYWREIHTFKNGTSSLQHLCTLISQKGPCLKVLQTLELSFSDLKDGNLLLKNKRTKRGAVNVVGNIANSLFGVLDSNYAEQMSNTIEIIKEDETHLKMLLRNQTSIIDSTLNILKQDELQIKQNFDNLDDQVNKIDVRLRESEHENYQFKLFQNFVSLSTQLSLACARLHRIQTAIITALSDSQHGKISPTLLSPSQLQSELIQVRNHLPSALQLPVNEDNLLQLYKIMSVKGGLTDNHVIFYITIPLSDSETLELLKLHPIPTLLNNTMVAIKPCSDIIAINAHRDEYYAMTDEQWAACTPLTEEEVLCSNMQSKFNADSSKCLCEISLINNVTQNSCHVAPITDNTSLIQLKHSNQWLYTMFHPITVTTVCSQEHDRLTLHGTGLIQIGPDCTLKYKSMFIQGHQTYTTSLHASYTATANISQISCTDEEQVNKIHLKSYADSFKNITKIQQQLHQQVLTDLPQQLTNIKAHHATVAYAALILVTGVIMTTIYKQIQRRKIELGQQTQQAEVRQYVASSEFMVSVS